GLPARSELAVQAGGTEDRTGLMLRLGGFGEELVRLERSKGPEKIAFVQHCSTRQQIGEQRPKRGVVTLERFEPRAPLRRLEEEGGLQQPVHLTEPLRRQW